MTGLTYFFVYFSVVLCIARGLAGDRGVCPCPKERYPETTGEEAMKLAIFDIDGTLVRGSTERLFWRYLAARGRQGPRQVLAYLLFLVALLAHRWNPHDQEEQGLSMRARVRSTSRALAERVRRDAAREAALRARGAEVATTYAARRHRGAPIGHVGSDRAGARGQRSAFAHVCATVCSERNGRLSCLSRRKPIRSERRSSTLAKQLAAQTGRGAQASDGLWRLPPRPVPAQGRARGPLR